MGQPRNLWGIVGGLHDGNPFPLHAVRFQVLAPDGDFGTARERLNLKDALNRSPGEFVLMESTVVAEAEATSSRYERIVTRRNFLGLAAVATAGMAFYAGEIARHELDIVFQSIHLRHLPDAFAGFKIVHISDFHLEEFTEDAFLKAVVRRVNALGADMVVLTGDFVSNKPLPKHLSLGFADRCASILSHLQCSLRYAVLGNHDGLVSTPAVTEALTTHGIPVLANRYVPIERAGQRLWLGGIEDALEGRPDLSKALPARWDQDREPLILLAHEPDFADFAIGRQISLVLSGHTHGGQILLPFLPPLLLPALGRKYVHGFFNFHDGMRLYVNRGIGAVNLPFRFRCPPEITVLTLQAAS